MRLFFAAVLLVGPAVFANASGAIGYSGGPPSNTGCNGCHAGGAAPSTQLTGPASLGAGATGTYTLTISGGAGVRAGMNVAVSDPNAALNPISATIGLAFGELHQKAPVAFPASFQFTMTAPPFPGTVKIFGTGNSCNGNGATSGDQSSSTTLDVTVTAGSGMNPPAITAAAATAFNPVTSRTVGVTVGANDDGTEANLSYTWSATGPAPVTFTPNGNNAAKASTAAFSKEGAYMLTVTVRDGTNKTVTSVAAVAVSANYTLLRMTPVSAQVAPGGLLVYTVSARDQFDVPLATQPQITYALPGLGGTFVDAGVVKAQGSMGGPFTTTANAMGITTGAIFSVGKAPPAPQDSVPPTVTLVSPATPGQPLAAGLMLEATAFDNTGVAEVRFEVAAIPIGTATAGPPWKVSYVTKPGIPGGSQALEAVAKDIAGNEARSASIPVMVAISGTGGGSGAGGGAAAGGGAGGAKDAGGAGGGAVDPPKGCGCSSAPFGLAAVALLVLVRRRR